VALICLDTRAVLGPSGLHRYCQGLIPELAAQAPQDQFVVIRLTRASREPFSDAPNVQEVFVDGVTGTLPLLFSRGTLRRVFEEVGTPDVLHAIFHVAPFGLRAMTPRPRKVVVSLHDLIWVSHPHQVEPTPVHAAWRWLLGSCAIRHTLKLADHVLCNSAATRRAAGSWIPDDRATVVHHGVHPRFIAAAAVTEAAAPVIAAFGVAKRYKNIRAVVEAFGHLAGRYPQLTLVLIGGDGGEPATIRHLGLGSRVTITGPLPDDDLAALMRRVSVFVVPSIIEGFGLPALEVMAAGVPLVVSDAEALVEVTGDVALRFPATDSAVLAARIGELLDDPGRAAECVRRGRARAQQFTWQRSAAHTLAVYNALLGRQPVRVTL